MVSDVFAPLAVLLPTVRLPAVEVPDENTAWLPELVSRITVLFETGTTPELQFDPVFQSVLVFPVQFIVWAEATESAKIPANTATMRPRRE